MDPDDPHAPPALSALEEAASGLNAGSPADAAADAAQTSWSLPDEVGGAAALRALLADLYDRIYDDVMIGFFFLPHDKQALIAHQYDYVCAHLGQRRGQYQGRSMRQAHERLPILGAHFDRRHVLLQETLRDHGVPAHVSRAWLELDLRLRPFVVRLGAAARQARATPAAPKPGP